MLSRELNRQAIVWAFASSLLLALPAMAAEDAHPTPGTTVSEEGPDASPRLGVTRLTSPAKPLPQAAAQLRRLNAQAGDKGSSFTDGAFGEGLAAPTALERMKLEQARMAIEASRAAGTLFSLMRPESPQAFSQEEIEFQKMRALEAMGREKRVPAGDPILLPGAPVPSLQLRGPEGLSEYELRKLDAFRRGVEFVEPASVRKAQPDEARPRLDEGRKDGKEGR